MRKYTALFFILVCALELVGCNTKSMNYIIENKPSVTGVVEEVYNDYVIISRGRVTTLAYESE